MPPRLTNSDEPRHQHLSKAYQLAGKLADGATCLTELADELRSHNIPSLKERLDRQVKQWSSLPAAQNKKRLEKLVEALSQNTDGTPRPFQGFKALIEDELAGLVVTAHPTFSLSPEAWHYASTYLGNLDKGEKLAGTATSMLSVETLHATRSPTLDEELSYATHAVRNMRRAVRQLYGVIFDQSAKLYPDDYRSLRPCMATIASWVGFDLDGRTDIDWSMGLLFRYQSALEGLAEYNRLAEKISADDEDEQILLTTIVSAYQDLATCFRLGKEALEAHRKEGTSLGKLNRLAVQNLARKEAASTKINEAFEQLLARDIDHKKWCKIATLYTEWQSIGLGLSRIHFRLNAAQLHNAIGHETQLIRAPDKSAMRRHYLSTISDKLASVEAETIHYGTLSQEQTTAKRVFMMAAQFMKHFDAKTSIRMLVAESDTPFTLLTALYYAKLFGVERHVDISPLFETAVGLERGDRVIAELLDNPHFVNYIKAQGRFCLQLGFSDSGRYIGQPAATLAIERFKLRLVRLWKSRKLDNVQLLFFDTHGESIGRGAYPESLKKRFLYTHPPRVREALATLSRPEKHEVSFQGGEGFLWFSSESAALATLTDFLEVRFARHDASEDRLYEEKGWALDFFLTLVEFQNNLIEDKGYVRLIDSIGRSLLYPTGSRSVSRQGAGAIHQRLERISQIRAIPNNAVLQQFGYMANSCAGLGTAIARSSDMFSKSYAGSDRLKLVTGLAMNALARSDIGIMESYASLLSPGYWLDRADHTDDPAARDKLRRLSHLLEGVFDSDSISACLRKLRHDKGLLDDCLDDNVEIEPATAPVVGSEIEALHHIRLGLIQFIFIKAMEIPRFSTRFDISPEDLLVELLHLEVPDTVSALKRIFPEAAAPKNDEVYGEEASYTDTSQGYEDVHRDILDPIEQAYDLVLVVSGLLAMKLGAIG